MATSCLRTALFSVSLLMGSGEALLATAPAAPGVARPEVSSLTITLDDGRNYSLSGKELRDNKGGAVFWGDWAVSNLLVPFYFFSRQSSVTSYSVIQYWWTPGRSGDLPAFVIQTSNGPTYPLDAGGPAPWARPFQPAHRPRVAQIAVGYKDGRSWTLSELVLRDEKSGVILWNDYSVENLLVPFYAAGNSLVTSASDVVRTWNSPTAAISDGSKLVSDEELPGFLVKPRCIPSYPGPE